MYRYEVMILDDSEKSKELYRELNQYNNHEILNSVYRYRWYTYLALDKDTEVYKYAINQIQGDKGTVLPS